MPRPVKHFPEPIGDEAPFQESAPTAAVTIKSLAKLFLTWDQGTSDEMKAGYEDRAHVMRLLGAAIAEHIVSNPETATAMRQLPEMLARTEEIALAVSAKTPEQKKKDEFNAKYGQKVVKANPLLEEETVDDPS